MNIPFTGAAKVRAYRALAAASLALGCVSAWALPVFTLNPMGATTPLNGGSVTADNIIVSDYFRVVAGPEDGTFTQTGFLSVEGFQLANSSVSSPGLNSTYGLYISFSGTGQQLSGGNPLTSFTSGSLTKLDYTLFGYNGPAATFSFNAANEPTSSVTTAVALATGTLIQGSVSTAPALNGTTASFVPSANASVTFTPVMGQGDFFANPPDFYNLAFSAFTNPVSTVTVISATEFLVTQGGGSFNFAEVTPPIPEPETYALMLAGLGAVSFVAKRRKKQG